MDKRMLRRLQKCLDKAEQEHINGLDAVDESVLSGLNSQEAVSRLCASVKASRAHNDEATALCQRLLSGSADDGEGDKSARRTANLATLDRADVGRAKPKVSASQPQGVGGAFLAAQLREDDQKLIDAYWA